MGTLDEAYVALQAELHGTPPNQTVDLAAAAARTPLGALAEALALLRLGSSFTVAGVALSRQREEVLLTGAATFLIPGQVTGLPATASLRVTEPTAGTLAFIVALTVTKPGWTFADSFSTLPHTLRSRVDAPGVEYGASTLQGLEVASPTFTAASGPGEQVHLSGSLQPTGDLAAFRSWVSPWPLRLEGAVTLPAAAGQAPELDLLARARDAPISLPPIVLERPGFAIVAEPEPPPAPGGNPQPPFSELQVTGTVTIDGHPPIVARLSATLLVSSSTWRLLIDFDGTGPSILGGLAQLGKLLGLDAGELRAPPALGGFESFALDEIEVWVSGAPSSGLSSTGTIAATIRSKKVWNPPIPFLTVSDVGTRWLMSRVPIAGKTETVVAGSVFGSFVFQNAAGEDPGIVDLSGALPSFVIEGAQREETSINLTAAFDQLLGRAVPAPATEPPDPKITALNLYADPFAQVFQASATLTVKWPVPFFAGLSITQLSFEVSATQSSLSGAIAGRIQLGEQAHWSAGDPVPPPAPVPALLLRAEAPARAQGGWVFSAGLAPGAPLTLARLLEVIGISAPAELSGVQIDRLDGRIDTLDRSWTLSGAVSAGWKPTLFGRELAIAAGVEFDLAELAPATTATGWVAGHFSVNRFAVSLRKDVGVPQPTYALRVQFGEVWLQAVTAWINEEGVEPYEVVAIQLGGVTLGDILEEIVNLAAPTLGFSLDPPWDVLKRIELSRFTLTIDPTHKKVSLTYEVNADLLLLRLDTIGVSYTMGASSSVDLIITGRFLEKSFTPAKPLKWDVVNDPPPAVPGKGPKLIELRYMGLGQRVRLKDPQPDTVSDAIARLREDMKEKPPDVNPLSGSEMVFDSSSQWLIGLDMRVLETVQIALVFNDPRLYGLSIGLEGERAGALAGLRFEILYKQLAPGLGMFRIELRIPEAFRHIELGEVSITLGTIVVEIYTNGNFMIDLGFPYERNYERSFTVQVFPFIGRGGIYFGVLDGATSRRVPAITNGTFSPVLELGIGLAVGVGKEISIGPLSGGAYVELEVIFQGVLAWFHPTGSDTATDRYHWAQGIVAIHGKVWGEVDFYVVKASVTLEAYAQATVVFEAYRATTFELEVRVEAEAEIEILFVTVSFSFDVELDLSFTVGGDEEPPWTLANPQPPRTQTLRTPRRLAAHQRAQVLLAAEEGEWSWPENYAAFPLPRTLTVSMLPTFSLANAPLSWTATPPPAPERPEWRMAFPLFAANGVPPGARTAAQATAPPHDPENPLPAASVVSALLKWSLAALPTGVSEVGKVTAGELSQLAEEMTKPYVAQTCFTRDRLATFFETNLHLEISGDPGSAAAATGAMAFPVPPWLKISATPGGVSDLYSENLVGSLYEKGVREYMAEFAPVAGASVAGSPDDPATYQSFAARVFCDWCLMVAREAVRQAALALVGTTVAMAADLDSTAQTLPSDLVSFTVRPGETIQSMAAWLGAGAAELEALNTGLEERIAQAVPGTRLEVTVGVAGCTLAVDNASRTLAAKLTVTVKEVRVQIRSQDTLDEIAKRLYGTAAAARLVTEASLASDMRLLRTAAPVSVPVRTGMGNDLALLAATTYVRYFADFKVPNAVWYAQSVADANQAVMKTLAPGSSIPTGTSLKAPSTFGGLPTDTYVSQLGDTLLSIGATLSLSQAPTLYTSQVWQKFRGEVLAAEGGTLPAAVVNVLPGESLEALSARLLLGGGVPALLIWLESDPVLDPLAIITLPSLPLSTDTHTTLADIATTVGLTMQELAQRKELTEGIALFASGTQLTVTHLPAQTVESLITTVSGGSALADISKQASRNLLGGMRLPAPIAAHKVVSATGPLTGLAELAGWQLPAPLLDGTSSLEVTVTASEEPRSWITFAGGSLKFTYTNAELGALYPAASLGRLPERGPQAIALTGEVPRTYGLDHRIALQAAVPIAPLTTPGTAPTLWRFPDTLSARARAATSIPYDTLQAGGTGTSVAGHEILENVTFGTLVPFTVRRLSGREHVYELIGADTDARDLLGKLAIYARADTPTARTAAYLAVVPVPGASDPTGLAVLDANSTATFAIRANMASEAPLLQAPEVVSAGVGELARFLQLLWEASIAGSGYHLGFATVDGQDLQAGVFAEDGTATLWLLAVPREQLAPAPTGRKLLAINNCAIVGEGLDSSAHALYVEAHEAHEHPSEMVSQALVPAGSAGVTLTVPRAMPSEPSAPLEEKAADRLGQLLSLLVMKIGGATYSAPLAAPPAPPQREDGAHLPRWRRQRLERAARLLDEPAVPVPPVEYWRYDQVVALSRFGPPSVAPAVQGLPAPGEDPYRGFGAAAAMPKALFGLGYADILGNITQQADNGSAEASIGYIDPLLGPGAWPGATTAYGVAAAGALVTLTLTVAAQPGVAVPAPSGPRSVAADAAARQAARYAEAYFQLAQPTVSGSLVTTLHQDAEGAALAVALSEGTAPLWRFTAAGYLYASAAAELTNAPFTGLATLAAVTAHYGIAPRALGAANADQAFSALATSGQPVTVAARIAVTEGDSAKTVLERVPLVSAEWPLPSGPGALLQLAPNPSLPVREGTVLTIKEVTFALPSDASALTLPGVASEHHTTAAQLAIDSASLPILRAGFSFSAGGATVAVDGVSVKSFADVQSAFAALAIDVAYSELAQAAGTRDLVFADAAQVELVNVVARSGDTLSTLAGSDLAGLAERNGELANVFPAGTMLSLGTEWRTPPVVPGDPQETLGQFAQTHGSTPALVLASNQALSLPAKPAAILPGIAPLPATPPPVPYTISTGDTLRVLEPLLGMTPEAIAEANEAAPWVLAANVLITVEVGGTSYETTSETGDTLAKVTQRLHAKNAAIDLAAVVAAIQDRSAVLAVGGLLVVPAPPLAAREASQPVALTGTQVTAAYGVDALSFAQANASLPGLLASGIELTIPGSTPEPTAPADSFNAVLGRLAARGIQIDLSELLQANVALAVFTQGARVLLPPMPVSVSAPIGEGKGPFRDPVFPLTVLLRLQRDQALVLSPTTAHDGPVERADTTVPAPTAPHENDGSSSWTLDAFVTAFEQALPSLRLGTARVEGTGADLWAVDFTAHGISSVAVRPTVAYPDGTSEHPRYLALRPLYEALQSRTGVQVPDLDANGAIIAGQSTSTDFQGIDVEVWARRLLADLDLFVSAPYAAAIHEGTASSPALDALLAARWKLCGALAAGLAPVLAVTDSGATAGRAAALADLERMAGAGLAQAYEVSTVMQFDATVASAYSEPSRALRPALLQGAPHPPASTPAETHDYTLTGAPTALSATSSFVGFTLTVPDPAHHATIATGPLEYVYDTVQFAVEAVPGMEGYDASNLLSLVRPLSGSERPAGVVGDLGSPVVPIPLRSHPPVPLVLAQSANPSYAGKGPPTLKQATQWTFGLTYSHEHAEQDEILLTATFNIVRSVGLELAATPDLAAALGAYATLGDRLRELMSWYSDPPSPAPANLEQVRESVAGTAAKLIGDVATAWSSHWPATAEVAAVAPQSEIPSGESYHFRVAVAYGTIPGGGQTLASLTLTLDQSTSPGPTGSWPEVSVRDREGVFVALHAGPTSGTSTACVYTPTTPVPIVGWPAVRVEWPELSIASVGNGHASLSARRNEHLLAGVATNAAFVLSSATVTASDLATPLLEWNGDFAISGATLEAAFKEALTDLFASATAPSLTVSLSYGYRLVEPSPEDPGSGLTSFLPVALYPHQELSEAIAQAVDAAARAWTAIHAPAEAGGEWILTLSLSSWLDQRTTRPLLVLDRLVYPLHA